MNYEKLWNDLKNKLEYQEQYGNMIQQTISQSFLSTMNDLERESEENNDNKTTNI